VVSELHGVCHHHHHLFWFIGSSFPKIHLFEDGLQIPDTYGFVKTNFTRLPGRVIRTGAAGR
jgi:hypothetical protein